MTSMASPPRKEIIENMAKLLDNWLPHEGMEKLIDRFDRSVTYASFAGQTTASNMIVTDFLTVIKKQGSTNARTRTGSLETPTIRPGRTPRTSGAWITSTSAAPTPPRSSTNLEATRHKIRVRINGTWRTFWKIALIN